MENNIDNLKEFYPHYLLEHQNTTSRVLHFVGTTIVIVLLISTILTQHWWRMIFLPIAGYGFAWTGHFFFEKNKPATFKYPLYSLASDFLMFWDILSFQIDKKIEKANEELNRAKTKNIKQYTLSLNEGKINAVQKAK